ncbi:MAG: universal stress protein [Chloroflexi bacterium]|nr:universal stress protein [Chloroflexota bacterium]MBU1750944.1 universal stress protein [Chloroflexota bacterium]
MFEKILVPVDGSAHAKRAVEMAAALAHCHNSTVFLLHVIRDLSLPQEILSMIRSGEVTESRSEILEDSAEIILDNARQQLTAAGLTDLQSEYVMGNPASRILEYAQEIGADLVVIGHRGLGPSDGLLGGVARKIVNRTTVSVLIAT